MIIFITGFMGVGKTTIGEQLAKALNLPFVDLDRSIEENEGLSLNEMFSTKGETYFRQVERGSLEKIIAQHTHAIVALGGGTMCYLNNHRLIIEHGISIFLEGEWKTILERILGDSTRPVALAKTSEELRQLYLRRLPYYRLSQLQTVVNSGFAVEKLQFSLKLLTNR